VGMRVLCCSTQAVAPRAWSSNNNFLAPINKCGRPRFAFQGATGGFRDLPCGVVSVPVRR
jgi:hypothetical protein